MSQALARKDALFTGSNRGGQTWAMIALLVEICRFRGVDPQVHLADVISRIVGGRPQRRLDELMLWIYPTSPEVRVVV